MRKLNNIFDGLPNNNIPEELFQTLIEHDNVKLERIISTGHTTPKGKWYDQMQDEWVLLLKGQAILQFEDNTEAHLQPGDYIFIESHRKHRVKYTSHNEPCVWLAVHIY
ncbi:MAG: cupin domain-containing protein [Pseudomonadota bacterium]